MRGRTATLECDNELRPTLAQHLGVSDRQGTVLITNPVCAVRGTLDASCQGPSAREAVCAGRTAFDEERDGSARMKAIKDADDECPVIVAMSTTHKYSHAYRSKLSTEKAQVRMRACVPMAFGQSLHPFFLITKSPKSKPRRSGVGLQ